MKNTILILAFISFTYTSLAQCNCENINRDDSTTITQCNTLLVTSNNNTQIGLSISTNQIDFYLGAIIRFKDNGKDVNSSITIRLEDNNMFSIKLVKSQLGNMNNSAVCACVFLLTETQIKMLLQSNIKTIAFSFTDNVLQMYSATSNADVLKNQLNCF